MTILPYPLTELFVWVVDDPTCKHGIVGVFSQNTGMMMQAASSMKEKMMLPVYTDAVEEIGKATGLKVELRRYILAEVVETR
jgi:hypothetical protein